MRYLLILSVFLIGCSKEEDVVFNNPYQLRITWQGTGYGFLTKDMLWTKEVNLNNEIFFYIEPDYRSDDSNHKVFNVDIEKLSDTNDVKVILTFNCDTLNIPDEFYGLIRDNIPDFFDIKEEVMVNFYEDKRTVILVEASSVCNPEITVFYE